MIPVRLVNGEKLRFHSMELFFVIPCGQQVEKHPAICANWMVVLPARPERLRPMAKHFRHAIESPMRQAQGQLGCKVLFSEHGSLLPQSSIPQFLFYEI